MAQIICKNNDRYNIYTTVDDGFIFNRSIDIDELKEFIKERHGENGIMQLPERLKRLDKNGHSAITSETLEQFLICNRAGENEETLSFDQCIKQYLS